MSAEFNVIVYRPKDTTAQQKLENAIAGVHIDAIRSYLDKANMTREQKLKLIDELLICTTVQ